MSEYARLVIAVDSAQAKVAERDLARLETQSGRTESAAVRMAGKIAAAFAGLKLADQIGDAITLASRYDQMGLVMQTVGENTGRTTAELEALDQALQETGISALQSRNNIIRMMSANIDLSQATELARLAQDAAVIANTNSSEAFERLIRGIQSAEKETLETMGLNVNFAQSYEKLAAQLGKNADNLTTVEKIQAGVNAAMEAGKNIAGAYDASMDNAGKRLASASRHLENFQIALGSSAQTEFAYAVDAYSDALKFLGENADTVAQIIETSLYTAAGLAAGALIKKTQAALAATSASRAQAAEELRLAQAHHATTAAALAHARANHTLMGATGQLTAATAAHEAAQRRLAAAQAASAGIGRAMLGIMGGPVGLAVTAGAVALSFVDWGNSAEEAARKSIALRSETELLARAVKELDAAQARQVLQRMEEPYKEAQEEARKYRAQVEYLNAQIARHPGSAKVDEWNRSLIDARGNLSTVNQAIEEQEKKMRELTQRINENTESRKRNNDAAEKTDLVGQKWLASLQRQADFAGQLTELQKVNIAIEKGYAGTLSETDKAAARANAALIDKANASKAVSKATNTLADDYKSVAAGLERQIALHGQATELARIRYEIENGNLQGLAGKQARYIEGLARELDMKRQLREMEQAGKDYQRIMSEIAMDSGENPELNRLNETYFRRKEIIDAALEAEYLAKEQHDAALVVLDQATANARMQILEDYKRSQEQATLQTMSSIITITQTQVQQMQSLVEEGGAVGKAFFVMTQGLAAANSIIHGFQSAMAIRVAYAQMAAMSGPAAPGILAAGETHAGIAQAMGFATAGMIAAQTIQSFDGGGYTGNGPRVGGLDGKGGFMAMVHPQETIIDHTKQKPGRAGGPPEVNFTAQVVIEAQAGMSPEETRAQGEMAAGAMRATFMSMIEKESRPGGLLWSLYGGGR